MRNNLSGIDLHIHTTASDGVFPAEQIVKMALERELHTIAITDHDTTDGIQTAQLAAEDSNLRVIPGIEINSENANRSVDILGYMIDIHNAALQELLVKIRSARFDRAVEMVKNLQKMNVAITLEQVQRIADRAAISRPHIGRALIESGAVKSLQEAFEVYISAKSPAYVPRYKLLPAEAITLIHQAGGVAVLAHPVRYKNVPVLIEEFAACGLDGVEVYYPDHSQAFRRELLELSKQHNLIVTGGSDFHHPDGDGSLRLGRQAIPAGVIPALEDRQQHYQN